MDTIHPCWLAEMLWALGHLG